MNKGFEAEVLFDYLAIKKGLNVSRPLFHCDYDRIVDSGGKLSRVQIKSTTQTNKDGSRHRVCVSNRHGECYDGKVDFVAVYIIPEDSWLIIQAEHLQSKYLNITMSGKAKKYINKWDALF